jgi:hypothetical protein
MALQPEHHIEQAEGFSYPAEFLAAAGAGFDRLDPWWVLPLDLAEEIRCALKTRYPSRQYIPFAKHQGCDDLACWEAGSMPQVLIVHDYSEAGTEERQRFSTFHEWLRSAFNDFMEYNFVE